MPGGGSRSSGVGVRGGAAAITSVRVAVQVLDLRIFHGQEQETLASQLPEGLCGAGAGSAFAARAGGGGGGVVLLLLLQLLEEDVNKCLIQVVLPVEARRGPDSFLVCRVNTCVWQDWARSWRWRGSGGWCCRPWRG